MPCLLPLLSVNSTDSSWLKPALHLAWCSSGTIAIFWATFFSMVNIRKSQNVATEMAQGKIDTPKRSSQRISRVQIWTYTAGNQSRSTPMQSFCIFTLHIPKRSCPEKMSNLPTLHHEIKLGDQISSSLSWMEFQCKETVDRESRQAFKERIQEDQPLLAETEILCLSCRGSFWLLNPRRPVQIYNAIRSTE